MTQTHPGWSRVAELLAFLPGFERPDRQFCGDASPRPHGPQGTVAARHPIYDDDVVEFFVLIGTAPWVDPHYLSHRPDRFVSDPSLIESAGFLEVRALLNLCSRGERFCDGYWLGVLRDGVVQAALRRLEVISRDAGRSS